MFHFSLLKDPLDRYTFSKNSIVKISPDIEYKKYEEIERLLGK